MVSNQKDERLGAFVDEVIVEIVKQRVDPEPSGLPNTSIQPGYVGPAYLWSDGAYRTTPEPKEVPEQLRAALVELVAATKRLTFIRSSPWSKLKDYRDAQAFQNRAVEKAEAVLRDL